MAAAPYPVEVIGPALEEKRLAVFTRPPATARGRAHLSRSILGMRISAAEPSCLPVGHPGVRMRACAHRLSPP
jgi:hypothetical protein